MLSVNLALLFTIKRFYKKLKWAFITLLLATFLLFFNDIVYIVFISKSQLEILYSAKPVEDVLKNHALSPSEKSKIQFIQTIKEYAVKNCGFKPTNVYSTFYGNRKANQSFVVTACKPFEFTEKKWWFPVIGNVSYKGYFSKNKAEKDALKLKEDGWDVGVGKVGAYSTLGWFNDPIMADMLQRDSVKLALLIFHELFHSSLYSTDNLALSENLADFVAFAAIREVFLSFNDSININKLYRFHFVDSLMNAYFLQAAIELEKYYSKAEQNNLNKKSEMISNVYKGIFKLPLSQLELKKELQIAKSLYLEGNDFFMSYRHYGLYQNELSELYYNRFKGRCYLLVKHFLSSDI